MFTMTDPNYSGQGIMTKLFGQTITEAKKLEYSGIFGFANQNSRYMFTKKLNFLEIVQMSELSINIQDTNAFLKNDSCTQISRFDEKFTKFFEEHKPINKYVIERTTDYLNWRFFENPEINYTVYEIINDEEIQGYFVLKNYENKKGHIVDFILINNNSISQMISKSIDFCKQNNLSQLTLWANPQSELYRMCQKNNFYPQLMPTFFIVNATTNLKPDILNYINWYITMSDSDVF